MKAIKGLLAICIYMLLVSNIFAQTQLTIDPSNIHGIVPTPGSEMNIGTTEQKITIMVYSTEYDEMHQDIVANINLIMGVKENIRYYTSLKDDINGVGNYALGFAGELAGGEAYVIVEKETYSELPFLEKFYLISHEMAHHMCGDINGGVGIRQKYQEHLADHLAGFMMGRFSRKFSTYHDTKMSRSNIEEAVTHLLKTHTQDMNTNKYPIIKTRIKTILNGFDEGYNFE